jgi:hypothetical protein
MEVNLDLGELSLSMYKDVLTYLIENNIGNIHDQMIRHHSADKPFAGFKIFSVAMTEEDAVMLMLTFDGFYTQEELL